MRLSLQALVLTGILVGCSDKQPPLTYDPKTARSKIVAALPSGWTATNENWQQRPDTTSYFDNPRTEAFVLIGPQLKHGYHEDNRGEQHREDIYKEGIFVWIVPNDFSPTFPRLPANTSLAITNIFSAGGIRVYADVSNYNTDTNRWREIMDEMGKNGGSFQQPIARVSWKSWSEDIAAALKK